MTSRAAEFRRSSSVGGAARCKEWPAETIGCCFCRVVVVARAAKQEAESERDRYLLALQQHHQILCAIAGSRGRRPLRLLPQDQSKLAGHALDLLQQNFPEIAERLGLLGPLESG